MREYGAANPEAEVAVVLLNQRVMAGLGNVYKSEVAFAAGVNPFRWMSTIAEREMEVMAEFAQKYMRANVVDGKGDGIVTYAGNRRTTHEMDGNNRLWVYGRQGEECRRCGAAIMMRKQGSAVRSTYWCPSCQPWVAAEGQRGGGGAGWWAGEMVGARRRRLLRCWCVETTVVVCSERPDAGFRRRGDVRWITEIALKRFFDQIWRNTLPHLERALAVQPDGTA